MRSFPRPPSNESRPGPPSSRSLPEEPKRKSLPARPKSRSLPLRPKIVSAFAVPRIVSGPGVPKIAPAPAMPVKASSETTSASKTARPRTSMSMKTLSILVKHQVGALGFVSPGDQQCSTAATQQRGSEARLHEAPLVCVAPSTAGGEARDTRPLAGCPRPRLGAVRQTKLFQTASQGALTALRGL